MTTPAPPPVATPTAPPAAQTAAPTTAATTDPSRDLNAHNGVALTDATNGYTAIDNGSAVTALDSDSDGLTDDFEKLAGTNPLAADSDADGLTDGYEAMRSHTDPLAADTDKDGIADAVELAAGSDAGTIPGIGGVSGLGEHAQNVRAGVFDSDLDGLTDPYEMQIGTNPAVADSDLDGLDDNFEVTIGSNPMLLDTDHDGLADGMEVQFGMNPMEMDAGTGPPPVPVVVPQVAPVVVQAAPPPVTTAQPTTTTGQIGGTGSVQHLIDVAMAQVGDQYVFGAEVSETDPDPSVWDCAEFTQWSAYQVGAEIPGSSFEQYLDLKAKGLIIPVDQAMNTPGALLFHFSSEPQPGGGRPSEAHVALSLGNGQTVEAQSEEVGVITDDAGGRFEYAALLPNVDYAGTGEVATAMPDAPADTGMGGGDMPDATGLTQDMVIYGIKMQESRGDYGAENPTSTASGAYQYIDGTWDGYGGYMHASDAPPEVQDVKMRMDTQAAYDRLGDWERVIASHFAGEGEQAGPKSDWEKVPGYDYNQNPSIWDYVHGVEGHIAEADPSMFGGAAPALPTAVAAVASPTAIADPQHAVDQFLAAAMGQQGDTYEFGAEADLNDANPTAFDRSELTQWAAHQAGIEIPDGSAAQYLDLKAKGLIIPVEQAANTPGALLFTFSSEPTEGGPRPDTAHVAISLGNGTTVEADDVNGVSTMPVGGRFQYAAVLPGLQGFTPAPYAPAATTTSPVATPAGTVDPTMPGYQIDPGVDISDPNADSDNDGLTNHFEATIGSNPTVADTDLDGLIDGFEASLGTDPTKMDTDLDGFTDGMEIHFGTNPLEAATGMPGTGTGSALGGTMDPAGADADALDDDPMSADAGLELH